MQTPYRFLATMLGLVLLGAALIAADAARAGDEGLYGPAAPPGSAFIRVFNGTGQSLLDGKVGPETFNEIPPYEASEFTFLPPGNYTLNAGGTSAAVSLKADRFYTAALLNGKIQVLDNERYGNRLKALVIVYNLAGGGEVSLRTADGKTAVVDKVAPNGIGQREVNAVKTQLALYRGEQRVASTQPIALERGRAFSLFVAGTPDHPLPVWVVN
jgi:alginate O-acetyltransferase complex protein AlgF